MQDAERMNIKNMRSIWNGNTAGCPRVSERGEHACAVLLQLILGTIVALWHLFETRTASATHWHPCPWEMAPKFPLSLLRSCRVVPSAASISGALCPASMPITLRKIPSCHSLANDRIIRILLQKNILLYGLLLAMYSMIPHQFTLPWRGMGHHDRCAVRIWGTLNHQFIFI